MDKKCELKLNLQYHFKIVAKDRFNNEIILNKPVQEQYFRWVLHFEVLYRNNRLYYVFICLHIAFRSL